MKRFALLLACLALPALAADSARDATQPPINLDIGTPTVIVVKHSLAQRTSRLVRRFTKPARSGLGADGFIYLRDGVKLSLAKRQIAEKLIDVENLERKALVQALADSNGRRNDEARGVATDARTLAQAVEIRLVAARRRGQVEPQALTPGTGMALPRLALLSRTAFLFPPFHRACEP